MSTHKTLTDRRLVMVAALSLVTALALPTVALARYSADTTCRATVATADATVGGETADDGSTASTDAAVQTADEQTADEQLAKDLAFVREEERLAHDVYVTLGEKWDVRVFSNIARSEQKHTDAVLSLLKAYHIPDPSEGLAAGEYADPELQQLHDDLVARGSQSVTEAYAVGRLIEQTDIDDLDERIARTDEADVLAVYQNLRAGSVNHLAAFSRTATGGATGSARNGSGSGTGAAAGGGRGRR